VITLAAVLLESGKPLALAELEVPPLKPGQVLVKIAFSGVCRTQLLECRGHRGDDPYLPHCLGHEGSGVVSDVAPGVRKVKAGDPVILSWMKGAGAEVSASCYPWGRRRVNAGAITTFSHHAVISENRVTLLAEDIPMHEAALLGCAVATGLGSVLNTARPQPGESLAVFGTGGLGLCAVGAAVLAGCKPVVAVDVRENMLPVARQLGATHCVHANNTNPVQEILRISPGGVDCAVEASGRPDVMRQALESVRARGGRAIIVGNARHGERVELDPREFNLGKRILGTWGGDSVPDRDFPRYARLLRSRQIDLRPLVSTRYSLDQINVAIDDLEAGRVVRPLVDMALC
jgi:S-(hydroxymethyl)glutathione dehydrogenase/alcohol dehydrogenase